jgi:hypothetical protein
MDKKSNIFDSDDESEDGSQEIQNSEGEKSNFDDMENTVSNSNGNDELVDNGLSKEDEDEEEEEVFINPITGLPMSKEESEMELDPITGMPIYDDDFEQLQYINSIVNKKSKELKSSYDYSIYYEDKLDKPKKKEKKIKEKSSGVIDLNDYVREMREKEEINSAGGGSHLNDGKFRSQRAIRLKQELGLVKEKTYKYKLNSLLPKPEDPSFSKKIYASSPAEDLNLDNEEFPSL